MWCFDTELGPFLTDDIPSIKDKEKPTEVPHWGSQNFTWGGGGGLGSTKATLTHNIEGMLP